MGDVRHHLPATIQRLFCARCHAFLGYEYHPARFVRLQPYEAVGVPFPIALIHVETCNDGAGPHPWSARKIVAYGGPA